ncbi:nickel pincer cofactor biosynthesis protein LarC [Methanonatronarchaeum sp. AMET-Sl]|uniref:nickel pincer cofactor biosynthesis protein LarC n=1 Tax=Methanonatronarchaeum sp. AMET-Sl TaxID=3037654 RepID=UPI00244DF561|nr:nickel pincer cofactor biosynthesis protein LarC [Methanonatronarchaeum sp. AMET-Sl]WGI17624.1 nickel pincer cofactor biosynthesis protein LarC [Methanonatronarchaeum sp. AMET-Sl]
MDIVVFDPKMGAAGDMIISCLIDAGADPQKVLDNMETVANTCGEINVRPHEVKKNSIKATKIDIEIKSENPDLSYKDMQKAIKESGLDREVCDLSLDILLSLKKAERKVHGPNHSFHEVGKLDALADIVGAATAYHNLKLNEHTVYSTPLMVGDGYIKTSHGNLPIPVPAVTEILTQNQMTWAGGPVKGELLTPTGAAILSNIIDKYTETTPPLKIKNRGRGAGTKNFETPNILTIYLGQTNTLINDFIGILETNVDDVDGETIGYLIDKLMNEGALDVFVISGLMKKGRKGELLKVLVEPEDIDRLAEVIVRETGSLGVRINKRQHRLIANRRFKKIEVLGESIQVKVGFLENGEVIDVSAEYDDCIELAKKTGKPLKEIKEMAESKARREL